MHRLGVCKDSEGSGEQRKMEENGCEVICATSTTPVVKGQVKKVKSRSVTNPINRNGKKKKTKRLSHSSGHSSFSGNAWYS